MAEPIISVSGMRGIVGDSLTPQIAVRYAQSLAAELPPGKIVITRDGRASGAMLVEAIIAGLTAVGRDVVDAAVAATPTTGILVRQSVAAGGIQVSASHNPAEYNGLKLFSAAGRVIPAADGAKVLGRYRSGSPAPQAQRAGVVKQCRDSTHEHRVLVERTADVDRIRRCGFKVLLDANHGAGSILGRELLEDLGCSVIVLGDKPDGQFAHVPEPTAENLAGILPQVVKQGCDIGFCQDPDADRLAVIDARGRYLGEEYTLALCVDHRLREQRGPIVINCSTSRMSQDLAAKYGVPCHLTAVGEANVVDQMLTQDALLGGEGNGGVIDPRVGWVRDSFVGMALILAAMAERERTVAELADELPRYEIVKTKLALSPERMLVAMQAIAARFGDATPNWQDGLRLDWPEKWLLIRGSNTEPIVRIIAEAPTIAAAEQLCREAREATEA